MSGYKFCSALVAEIGQLNGVTPNIQTQCDNAIKKSGTTTLMGDVVLSGLYKFVGVTTTELSYQSGVTSSIQTQLNSSVCDNSTTTLSGNIVLSNSANNQFTFAGAIPTLKTTATQL